MVTKEDWIADIENAMNMIENACGILIWDNDKKGYNFEICEERCPFFKVCETLRKASDYEYDYAEHDFLRVFGK